MGDIGGDEEAVGVGAGEDIGTGVAVGKGFGNALDGKREEVPVRALAKEGANFFVVEEGDDFDNTAVVGDATAIDARHAGRRDEGFYGGEGTQTIVDAACKDEFFIQATELRGLNVV